MKPVRVVCACSLVIAFGTVGVGAASAEAPEWGQCLKKAEAGGSGFVDSKCTKDTEGSKAKYEWLPGAVAGKNTFTMSGGALTWATTGGKSITCSSSKAEGEYSLTNSKRWDHVSFLLVGCVMGGVGSCTSAGRASGELLFNELAGEVGYEDIELKNTALKLYPGPSAKGKFVEFKCVGLEVKLRGKSEEAGAGILVPIDNDRMTVTETLTYKASKGIQKSSSWEGLPSETYLEQNFENLGWERTGWTMTEQVTNDEAMKYELNFFV